MYINTEHLRTDMCYIPLSEAWMTPRREWLPGHRRLRRKWLPPGGNDSPMTRMMRWYKLMGSDFLKKKIGVYLPQHTTLHLKMKALQGTVTVCVDTHPRDWDRNTGSLWRVVWIVMHVDKQKDPNIVGVYHTQQLCGHSAHYYTCCMSLSCIQRS